MAHMADDASHHVRTVCAFTLLSNKSDDVINAFVAALNDADDKIVLAAIAALSKNDENAASRIGPMLDHPSWQVRYRACMALLALKQVTPRVLLTARGLQSDPFSSEHDNSVNTERLLNIEFPEENTDYTTEELIAALAQSQAITEAQS